MSRRKRIEKILQDHFHQIEHCELVDESHQHAVPEGAESHFNLFLVNEKFNGQSRVQRQRSVYGLLADEFNSGLHALTLRLLTKEEWKKQKKPMSSPDCAGRNKF